jgi:hypothetical protein
LLALALVPADDVINAFEELMKSYCYSTNEEVWMTLHHISKLIGSAKDLVVHPGIQFHFGISMMLHRRASANKQLKVGIELFRHFSVHITRPFGNSIEALRKEQTLDETKIVCCRQIFV